MFYYRFPTHRSNRPIVFCKKAVLKNFAKFTQKNACARVSFFNKVECLRPATLSKERLWPGVFL